MSSFGRFRSTDEVLAMLAAGTATTCGQIHEQIQNANPTIVDTDGTDATQQVSTTELTQTIFPQSFYYPVAEPNENEIGPDCSVPMAADLCAGLDAIELETGLELDKIDGPLRIAICSMVECYKAESSFASRSTDRDARERDKALAIQLRRNAGRRELWRLPEHWQTHIQVWRGTHPNGEEFLELIEDMRALAARGDGVLRMPPIVLDGPPGSGKSVLAEAVAGVFSGGYIRVSMAGMEMGSELGGSDPGWGNARIGKVMATLSSGSYANPVFLLDEIDKTEGSASFSPWAPLHDLLEPACARAFRDRCYDGVAIDASNILWIATSNRIDRVPDAIRDRLTVVTMPLPTVDQSAAVVESVWAYMQADGNFFAGFQLSADMHLHLIGTSPRTMRQRLHRACARAAREGATLIEGKHLPSATSELRRAIGF